MTSSRHLWSDKVRFPLKSEQQCFRCGMVKVGRHEVEAGKDVYWSEFWRDQERLDDGSGATPPCDRRFEAKEEGGDQWKTEAPRTLP